MERTYPRARLLFETLDAAAQSADPLAMERVSPIPQQGAVFFDPRDDDRFLRVSFHDDAGVFVLSWWRNDTCLGTHRLATDEAPRLIHALASGLATGMPSSAEAPPAASTA
jgi:hypothetical protein